MSKPVHSKNEILRSNTGLIINPSKVYPRSETRDKLTGLTIFQGGLFRQSQATKNRFPSRATGIPSLDEHTLIVFCMLLVSSVQVKHQGSDQSPRISIHSIQVKHQGSNQGPRFSVSIPSRSSFKVQVKVHGFRSRSTVSVSVPSRSTIKAQVKVHGFSIHSIHVKCQGSDRPSMVIVIHVKHQGSDHPSMPPAIQIKRQGPDHPSMFIVCSHPGQASRLRSPADGYKCKKNVMPIYSLAVIYLQSPAIQAKHQGSDLPAMVIVLNPPRSCFTDSDSVRGYRPNSKDQNSNLGYSSNIKDLISNQGYGYTLFSLSLHAFFRIGLVLLRSGYTMKILVSFQCDRYIHLVRPLVTVGFVSLLASQSKPAIMDPISVQCYSVLAVKVPLLSMPMIPNPSPIQSDRATIKDPISIQYDSVFTAQVEEQGFLLHPRLQPRPIDPGLLSSRVTSIPEANDQSFDILLGSQQAFNDQLYIKGRRYTRIFKQFTKN
ncbi:hypothetical protein F4703DRAFT_1791336 [Phycomyces blakesleeanus]